LRSPAPVQSAVAYFEDLTKRFYEVYGKL
jgi:hypothetical protein